VLRCLGQTRPRSAQRCERGTRPTADGSSAAAPRSAAYTWRCRKGRRRGGGPRRSETRRRRRRRRRRQRRQALWRLRGRRASSRLPPRAARARVPAANRARVYRKRVKEARAKAVAERARCLSSVVHLSSSRRVATREHDLALVRRQRRLRVNFDVGHSRAKRTRGRLRSVVTYTDGDASRLSRVRAVPGSERGSSGKKGRKT
jgi:hypothetical protein